ncbi:hypothetical protein [Vibrio natriegens]|uniref:hypothetical protein n=1 Tax=Vibrio natriegens TaxID=691 RepID=UPI001FB89A72|nr:hypothetical protein [Vibrio natriegens]
MTENIPSFVERLESLKFNALIPAIIIVVYVVFFALMLRNKNTREMLIRTSRFMREAMSVLFIFDNRSKYEELDLESSLTPKMEREIVQELLDRGITRKVLSKELSKYCDEKLETQLKEYLSKSNTMSEAFRHKISKQIESNEQLCRTILYEQNSSASLKSRLTNLFILFTLVMLGANFIFGSEITDTNKILVAITYITLSSFLIFIIRTSHQRSAMLISIQEDLKKQSELNDYLIHYKKGKDLTEHDVEFLRLLMVSRAEREAKTSHPYEVILKNVSGSNIQLGKSSIKLGPNKSQTER